MLRCCVRFYHDVKAWCCGVEVLLRLLARCHLAAGVVVIVVGAKASHWCCDAEVLCEVLHWCLGFTLVSRC